MDKNKRIPEEILAPYSKRMGAFIIDISIPVMFTLLVAYMNNPEIKRWKVDDVWFVGQCTLFLFSLIHGYIVAQSSSSLGYKYFKIRVVKMRDYSKLSIGAAIIRSIICFMVMPIMLITLFFTPTKERKQTGWDILSGAIVINEV